MPDNTGETRLVAISDEQVELLREIQHSALDGDTILEGDQYNAVADLATAYEEGITEEEVKNVLAGQFVGGYGEGAVSAKLRSVFNQEDSDG